MAQVRLRRIGLRPLYLVKNLLGEHLLVAKMSAPGLHRWILGYIETHDPGAISQTPGPFDMLIDVAVMSENIARLLLDLFESFIRQHSNSAQLPAV